MRPRSRPVQCDFAHTRKGMHMNHRRSCFSGDAERRDVMRQNSPTARKIALTALACVVSAAASAQEPQFKRVPDPDKVEWKGNPLGPGLQTAIIDGDPSKPGV